MRQAAKKREEEARKGAKSAQEKLEKFQRAKKEKQQAKHRAEATSLLKRSEACTDLVGTRCDRDDCRFDTSRAHASGECAQAVLEKVGDAVEKAGMEGEEGAKRVRALLYERAAALEKVVNATAEAESLLAGGKWKDAGRVVGACVGRGGGLGGGGTRPRAGGAGGGGSRQGSWRS